MESTATHVGPVWLPRAKTGAAVSPLSRATHAAVRLALQAQIASAQSAPQAATTTACAIQASGRTAKTVRTATASSTGRRISSTAAERMSGVGTAAVARAQPAATVWSAHPTLLPLQRPPLPNPRQERPSPPLRLAIPATPTPARTGACAVPTATLPRARVPHPGRGQRARRRQGATACPASAVMGSAMHGQVRTARPAVVTAIRTAGRGFAAGRMSVAPATATPASPPSALTAPTPITATGGPLHRPPGLRTSSTPSREPCWPPPSSSWRRNGTPTSPQPMSPLHR
mmetsp:Transcript_34175/g.61256  ORF Transcript_34175/g.61256 Transcript_34175/m.61256 type:complete len:287 (+) Transcript_34175:402-1262(+)